jgi:hypothetical protein
MPAQWLKPVTRRDPWRPRWSSRDAILYDLYVIPGCSASWSTLESANKVYVRVQGTAHSATAVNDSIEPKYSTSPREIVVILRGGDTVTCEDVAALQIAARQVERWTVTGLQIPLRWGLGIQRGTCVQVVVPRAGINGSYPVRRLIHDFGPAALTTVDVGEYHMARTAEDAEIRLALKIERLEKEAAL